MHEYSIVQALYDSVMSHAGTGPGTIQEVRVRIGELSGVDPELLDTAWRTFRVHTPCDAADMTIHLVPPAWECPACRTAAPARGQRRCAACGGPLRLAEGDEILLDQIVMEVRDV
jgi:hydrogenase nickel incorporation protein HypA/HybF